MDDDTIEYEIISVAFHPDVQCVIDSLDITTIQWSNGSPGPVKIRQMFPLLPEPDHVVNNDAPSTP